MMDPDSTWQRTLDLAELARVNRGDRVEVGQVFDSTQDLFEQTLALVDQYTDLDGADDEPPRRPRSSGDSNRAGECRSPCDFFARGSGGRL